MAFRSGPVARSSIVGMAIILSTVAAQTAIGGSAFRVESPQVDVGIVTGGKPVTATFVFHNDSDRAVRILKAAPS